MSDNLKPEDRRKTMQAVKGKGTRLEQRLYTLLDEMGLTEWEKNPSGIVGKPDIVFYAPKVAIFADGCFWHGCPRCHRPLPQTNQEYWQRKIHSNVLRAKSYNKLLRAAGWGVVRAWEHQLKESSGTARVRTRIMRALGAKEGNVVKQPLDIVAESHQILAEWLRSCTRRGKISKNTIAVGIVVLDHLRRSCPVRREEVLSKGGEVTGARSGLAKILEGYGIVRYLKQVTTRQAPQDGQRLFERFEWGNKLLVLSEEQRDQLLTELIGVLRELAEADLKRKNLQLDINRREAPTTWINAIVQNAKGRSNGIVEQHLVGAKLARRFNGLEVPNYPAHAGDVQTDRRGDFAVNGLVYHVTAVPTRDVIRKCSANLTAGLSPVLLVPKEYEYRARVLAEEEHVEKQVTILAIEDFVALNIMELAVQDAKDLFSILQEIVDIYNRRLAEVETDLSLRIDVR